MDIKNLGGASIYATSLDQHNDLLRNSGVLKLPSQRTLRDYTYYTQATTGFSVSVDQQMMDAANILNCPEREKNVVIIFDEIHVREDLVYDKNSGKYI